VAAVARRRARAHDRDAALTLPSPTSRSRFGASLQILLLATAAACDSTGVTLYVDVRTDFVPGVEVAVIETRVEDVGVTRESAAVRSDDFVAGRRVAELTELAPSSARRLTVRLLDAGRREIASRTLVVDHRADRNVLVLITRACRDVSCSPSETCVAGSCQPEACAVEDAMCASECTSASDCAASACAAPSCEGGECFYAPMAGACAPGTYCDPSMGCLPDPSADSDGGIDAGVDAGIDAGPPPPPFVLHTLADGAATWTVALTSGSVPVEMVRAAFAPAGSGEMVAITDTSVHVLRVADRQWVARLDRAAVFPELEGTTMWEASAVPGTSPPLVFVYGSEGAWQYEWRSRSAGFLLFTARADFGADWSDPEAAPYWSIHGIFTDPDNADGWVSVDPSSECPGHDAVGRYVAFLSTDGFGPAVMQVSIYDIDCPFRFVEQRQYSSFPPFSRPSAPNPFSIEAVARAGNELVAFTPR
jgi:hypothetical protein